jgi:hypothetical protein
MWEFHAGQGMSFMKEIPLSGKLGKGLVTLVDDEDWPWLVEYVWHLSVNGYAKHCFTIRYRGHFAYMHRVVTNAPDHLYVDHKDHNPLNNQKWNLRICTNAQNVSSQAVRVSNKTSNHKGVSWDKNRCLWAAAISVGYRTIHLGRFRCQEEAAKAYNSAALKHFGQFAVLNRV